MCDSVTLEGTCKPAWACDFVSMGFTHHSGRNPKPLWAMLGSPNWAHLIFLQGKRKIEIKKKKKSSQKPLLGEFPKQISSLGSLHRNRKAPRGFPSACLDEDPQQHCSQGKGHGSRGATGASP